MSRSSPDLSSLTGAAFDEIRPHLEALAGEPEPGTGRALRALLLDRALGLLRRGSRSEIEDEALALNSFLDSAPGRGLRQASPETFGGFRAVGRMLSEAARRSDRAAVDSILLSHRGRGQQLLEALAESGGPVPRPRLKEKLGLSESHLSHLLRDLEEAELILRYRPAGGREVIVELGPVGREVVERSVLPSWVQHLADRLEELRTGGVVIDRESLARELTELGAPSRLVAESLAAALAELAPAAAAPDAALYVEALIAAEGGEQLELIRDRQGRRSPRALFATVH